MSKDRKDIRAYKGTMKMMRTMYLCTASTAYTSCRVVYSSLSICKCVSECALPGRLDVCSALGA